MKIKLKISNHFAQTVLSSSDFKTALNVDAVEDNVIAFKLDGDDVEEAKGKAHVLETVKKHIARICNVAEEEFKIAADNPNTLLVGDVPAAEITDFSLAND